MTRVKADVFEVVSEAKAPQLRFGDPIGCDYHWTEPGRIDSYGDSVRRLAKKVKSASEAFAETMQLPAESMAGEAADTLRERSTKRHEESEQVRSNLTGLGGAINDYAGVLRRHRDGLEQLKAYATSKHLEIRGTRIFPPVETLKDATQKQADAWEDAWKAYRECFDMKIELRDTRRAGARELVQALAKYADVHPDKDKAKIVAANPNKVKFGELRREAAEEAMEAVQAGDAAERAREVVDGLKRREQAALDSLEKMALADRPPEEIAAQADKVAALHRELGEARTEAREAEATATREQAEANRAARNLENAESGKSRPVGAQATWEPATPRPNLKDRLG